MHVLITGGTGFIGSRLALRCLGRGDAVTVLGQENTEFSLGSNGLGPQFDAFFVVLCGLFKATDRGQCAGQIQARIRVIAVDGNGVAEAVDSLLCLPRAQKACSQTVAGLREVRVETQCALETRSSILVVSVLQEKVGKRQVGVDLVGVPVDALSHAVDRLLEPGSLRQQLREIAVCGDPRPVDGKRLSEMALCARPVSDQGTDISQIHIGLTRARIDLDRPQQTPASLVVTTALPFKSTQQMQGTGLFGFAPQQLTVGLFRPDEIAAPVTGETALQQLRVGAPASILTFRQTAPDPL